MDRRPRHVKIIGTIGPASSGPEVLTALIEAGLDVARINCSHTAPEAIPAVVADVRAAADRAGRHVAVLVDLAGPKLRIDGLTGPVDLAVGAPLRIAGSDAPTPPTDPDSGVLVRVPVPRLAEACSVGDTVLLADGVVAVTVAAITDGVLHCRTDEPGTIGPRKGIHFPGVDLLGPAVTDFDRECIRRGLEAEADLFAVSFVQHASDVALARELIGDRALLVAKIERAGAIAELDAILDHVDAMLVARGDLGVELPLEEVPAVQKHLVARSLARARIPIVATEMLESMITNARPTRAEASDVANAALDGAAAVMLSAETAAGAHPVAAVEAMDRILRAVEHDGASARVIAARSGRGLDHRITDADPTGWTTALADAATTVAERLGADAIVALTETGKSALLLASARPDCPIVGVCFTPRVARRLAIFWGVIPVVVDRDDDPHVLRLHAARATVAALGGRGGTIVLLSGPVGDAAHFDNLRVALLDPTGTFVDDTLLR